MLVVRSEDFSEKQLAEIALAIQNRWEVPAFVKMHEIVVADDDIEGKAREELVAYFEHGLQVILENLKLSQAINFRKASKNKYIMEKIPGAVLPKWTQDIEIPERVPEGVHECPHCGRWFSSDIELSLHTKLHYLI